MGLLPNGSSPKIGWLLFTQDRSEMDPKLALFFSAGPILDLSGTVSDELQNGPMQTETNPYGSV